MARILDSLVGHTATTQQFLKSRAENRLPSTLLLVGPSGVGKRRAALGFAQALLCERSLDACGECPACLRVERESSEGLLVIAPEGTQIKVDQGRQILEFLTLQRIAQARVVLIDQAHLLNPQTSNALLKTFEEPPEETYFFLITATPASLLPTIRSRAQVLRFSPLKDEELERICQAPPWVIASAQGRVDLAQLFADEGWADARSQALSGLAMALENQSVATSVIKEMVRDKSTALFSSLMWQMLLRDISFYQAKSGPLFNVDHQPLIERLGARVEPSAIHYLHSQAFSLEGAIHGNVDRTLLFEDFLTTARHMQSQTSEEVIRHVLD